jgi:hypothetical protein
MVRERRVEAIVLEEIKERSRFATPRTRGARMIGGDYLIMIEVMVALIPMT